MTDVAHSIDQIPLDCLRIIVIYLKPIAFMRFVAAYPRVARDVVVRQKWYRSIFTAEIYDITNKRTLHATLLCGRLHSFSDNSAIFYYKGNRICKEWYRYGLLHRDTEPARVTTFYREWFQNGRVHRGNSAFDKEFHPNCWRGPRVLWQKGVDVIFSDRAMSSQRVKDHLCMMPIPSQAIQYISDLNMRELQYVVNENTRYLANVRAVGSRLARRILLHEISMMGGRQLVYQLMSKWRPVDNAENRD